jgi:hypothetical protein
MRSSRIIRDALITVVITIAMYLVLQAIIILMHEYAHSTAAWLLGYIPTPFTVVWGNLLTLRGWDEGVPYDRLFPARGNPAEALIGGIPLIIHTIIVAVGVLLLQRPWTEKEKWLFNALYWFVVLNLAELIAYIIMRPFLSTGDTGRFNEGLGLSSWLLFVVGTILIVIGLWILFRRILPVMNDVVARGNPVTYWAMVVGTAFILFLWGSGIRMMLLYPDPQWLTGLIGIAAFIAWIMAAFSAPIAQTRVHRR